MGDLAKAGAYLWRGHRNDALRHLREIAAALTVIRAHRWPNDVALKLFDISLNVMRIMDAIIALDEIATRENDWLRKKLEGAADDGNCTQHRDN